MNMGNTPVDLQNAIILELNNLFKDDMFFSIDGDKTELKVYPQDLPLPESDDDDTSIVSVPYAIVKISQGEVFELEAPAETDIVIVLCVYDDEIHKQAYRDVMHIINKVLQRFLTNPYFGNFRFKAPFKWALQDDKSYPYFFGGIEMTFESATGFVVEDKLI